MVDYKAPCRYLNSSNKLIDLIEGFKENGLKLLIVAIIPRRQSCCHHHNLIGNALKLIATCPD